MRFIDADFQKKRNEIGQEKFIATQFNFIDSMVQHKIFKKQLLENGEGNILIYRDPI
jgi:hypothetical protein